METLERIKEKLEESSDYYASLTNRKKRDIEIYSGNFWNNDTIKMCDRTGRLCSSFTQYSKFSNAIVSPFTKSPYHCEIEDRTGQYKEIQDIIDKFENDNETKFIFNTAVKNACITGTGFIVLSIENDEVFPELVRDASQVALDPNILELDGGDAEYGALVTYISKAKAKRLYGKEVVSYDGTTMFDNIGEQWVFPKDSIPAIAYYELNEDGKCELTKVCGNVIVQETIELPFDRIPIYRICFNEVVRNGKVDYNGIVDMTKDLMLAQSIAFSTLMERANRSPKANYMMEVSQLEGLDEFYKRLNTKESLVCLYNGEKIATPPVPITESYQTQDLQATIDSTANLMSQVIGIPIGGINPATETATEVLVQQANSESNVYSLYANANKAIRSMTNTILVTLCEQYGIDEIPTFRLVNGPEIITQAMKERNELNVIAQMLTDDKSRKIIAKHYIDTFDADTRDALQADLIANTDDVQFVSDAENIDVPELIQQLNIANEQLQTLQQQYQELSDAAEELKNENDQLNLTLLDQKQNTILAAQKQQQDYELNVAKLQLEQAKLASDDKNKTADIELKKQKADTETLKEVAKIEQQKMNIVDEALDRT